MSTKNPKFLQRLSPEQKAKIAQKASGQNSFLNKVSVGEKPKRPDRKIRIAFYGDSPTCATGFGQVSRNILPYLFQTGKYEIDILGINYWGDPHEYPFRIWPMAINRQNDPYGRQRMQQHLHNPQYQFDILFFLQDSFILEFVPNLLSSLRANGKKFKSIFYYPVDGIPKKSWIEAVAAADFPVTYSQFGYEQSIKLVPSIRSKLQVIPHGVNPQVFFPVPKEQAESFRRQYLGAHASKFVYLCVNRNQQRKDIPATIKAFKVLKEHRPNSLLLLHMAAVDQGWNLPEVIKSFGLDITKDVILPQNFTPSAGFPLPILNLIYNASDAVVSTTLGEGWGLCVHEDTYVNTVQGARKIKEIKEGDFIVLYGSEHEVKGVSSSSKNSALKITLANNKELVISSEHRLPVYERGEVSAEELTIGDWLLVDRAQLTDGTYNHHAIDLAPYADCYDDDYVWNQLDFFGGSRYTVSSVAQDLALPEETVAQVLKYREETKYFSDNQRRAVTPPPNVSRDDFVRIMEYVFHLEQSYPSNTVNRYISFDSHLAYLLGYYAAVGERVDESTLLFSFSRGDKAKVTEVLTSIRKVFDLEPDIELSGDRISLSLKFSAIARLFTLLVGADSALKKIPALCLQHRNKAASFIRGYWVGCGRINSYEIIFPVESERLKEELLWLLTGFDIFASSQLVANNFWSLHVRGDDYNLLAFLLGLMERQTGAVDSDNVIKTKEFFAVQIVDIETIIPNKECRFFDLYIPSVSHFSANGVVVHNSWTEAMACKKPVIFPKNTALTEWITEEVGFPYTSGGDWDHITVLPHDNEVLRPVAHIDEMVQKMIQVQDDAAEREKRAEAGYQMVRSKLCWNEHINPLWEKILDRAVDSLFESETESSGTTQVNISGDVL